MASDHGLSSTHSHLDVAKFFKKQKYRVLEYPSIWTLFPKVSVFISGNSFATVSFLDQKELYHKEDLMSKHGDAINAFVRDKAIDFILIRKNKHCITVINQEGEAEVDFKNDLVSYTKTTGNPLKLENTPAPLNDTEGFDFTFESEYPDSLVQIKQLFKSGRTGDIVVSANIGFDLRDFWEIPEHKGSHGSLHWEHMHIPIMTNKKGLLVKPIRSTEVYQLIRDHMDQ